MIASVRRFVVVFFIIFWGGLYRGLPVSYIPGSKQESIPIPLSKLENIPLIKFPKYPVSLEVNKNIPEITYTKKTYEYRNILSSTYYM